MPEVLENVTTISSLRIESDQNISAFIDSRIGGRSENQDSAGFQDTPFGAVIVVCDGMGGTNGGRIASTIAVSTILEIMSAGNSESSDCKSKLRQAIKEANSRIILYGREHTSFAGMGTTVTVAVISKQSAIVAYVGDSRIYQLRGAKKIFRTFDHSMVFEMVKRKVLTEEQARLSAQSNVILKALGVGEDIEPDIYELPYQKNDRFVLCSDGFWGAMSEDVFLKSVTQQKSPDKVLADVMSQVDKIGYAQGGKHDNLTAAFIDVKQNSILKEKMNTTTKIIIAVLFLCLLVSLAFNFIQSKEELDDEKPMISIPEWLGTPESESKWNKCYKLTIKEDTAIMLVTQHSYEDRVDTVLFVPSLDVTQESEK